MRTHFIVGHQSDQGPRDFQEDSLAIQLNLADPPLALRKGALFLVADGVGGSYGGDMASSMAADIIPKNYFAEPTTDVVKGLYSAFAAANLVIYEMTHPEGETHMATTAVCAVVRDDQLYVAHVGDSRAYLWHQGILRQLTEDHSWVAEQVRRGLLSVEQASAHPQRNVITRSLGAKPDVLPDVRHMGQLRSEDRLLLCSDGLHDVLDEASMAAVLSALAPPEACRELIELAKQAGTGDNTTVIVAEFHGDPDVAGQIASPASTAWRSRDMHDPETVRFCHSSSPAYFEETSVLNASPGKRVTCGLTVRPEDYRGRYPIRVELWVEAGSERTSRFLVGQEDYQEEPQRVPEEIPLEVVWADKEIMLPVSEFAVLVHIQDVNFASVHQRPIRQMTVRFGLLSDPVIPQTRR